MEFIVIMFLILANGVLSMSEISLVSLRKSKIRTEADKGNMAAKSALKLSEDPDKFFSTVQIGITLIGILTGIYSGDALAGDFAIFLEKIGMPQSSSLLAAQTVIVVAATYLTLIFGELIPKRIGFAAPEQVAKIIAAPMLLLSKVAHPFVWILSKSTAFCAKVLRIKDRKDTITEEEIKHMIAEGAQSGEVLHIEKNIVERTFTLGDRRVTSIMTPRPDIVGIEIEATKEQIISKDNFDLKENIREVCFLNEFVKVYDALETMRKKKTKYGVISGEFGITLGIITMNDVMDALLGNMPEKGEEPDIVERSDGSMLVDGQCTFYDFILKAHIDNAKDAEYNTVAGMILAQMGKIPSEGEKTKWNGYTFEVVDMDGIRIDKVLVYKTKSDA